MDGHEGGDCDDDRDTETDDEDEARDSDDYGDSGDGNDNEDGDDGADDDADDADGDDEAGVRNGPPASSPNCDCHILGMPNRVLQLLLVSWTPNLFFIRLYRELYILDRVSRPLFQCQCQPCKQY